MSLKKIFLSAIVSFALSSNLFSCAIEFSPFAIDNYQNNHINKDVISIENKLYLTQGDARYNLYWDRSYNNEQVSKDLNIKEWMEYLKNRYSKSDVEKWIYSKDKSTILDKEAEIYMEFAKKQEPFVYDIYDEDVKDFNRVEPLMKEATNNYNSSKSDFIKLRYAFLMMRLAHYYKNSLLALNLYEKYAKPIKIDSITNEWIEALVAGANRVVGNYPLAAYQFAKVFANNKTNNYIGLYDFKITNQKQWDELMGLCKSGEEKALMYTMRALRQNADGIAELDNIYKEAPNSIWFDLVLYRELNAIEFNYFTLIDSKTKATISSYEEEEVKKSFNSTKLKIKVLTQKLTKVVSDKKRDNIFFTKLSLAMLNLFEGKATEATNLLSELEKTTTTKTQKEQVVYLKELVKLLELKSIDSKIEEEIGKSYEKIATNFKKSYQNVLKDILYALYDKSNSAKRHLLKHDFNIDVITINIDDLKEIQKLSQKQNKNSYEKLLLSNYKKKDKYSDDVSNYYDEEYLFGVLNLRSFKFKEAQKHFSKSKEHVELDYNPFNALISGNNRKTSKSKITLKKFVDTLVKIEEELKKNPTSMMDNFLLANAYYNMSWFGNSPMSIRFYRATSSWKDDIYISMDKAKYYYEQALKYATKPEMKAKITYMLAKCELNEVIVKHDIDYDYKYDIVDNSERKILSKLKEKGFGKYFKDLENEYKNTKYYSEVLKECVTFRGYFDFNKRERR